MLNRSNTAKGLLLVLSLTLGTLLFYKNNNTGGLIGIFLGNMQPRDSWPECLGKPGSDCRNLILRHDPQLAVLILPEGSGYTRDLRMDRVRVFVNNDIVVQTPRLG